METTRSVVQKRVEKGDTGTKVEDVVEGVGEILR